MKENVTILSIDDDPQICFALGELFKFQGWRAVSASDVASGLEAFRRYSPDIVLIDYHMPGVSGIEGVKLLRKQSASVPIIVFTIDESPTVADTFLAAGASDFALKPIKAPDIVSRIRLHLRLAGQNQPEPAASKGISGGTLGIIMSFLSGQSDYVTANEIAEGTGLAYQTVYRYLQHLVQDKKVERLDVYGKVGRPKQVFRRL